MIPMRSTTRRNKLAAVRKVADKRVAAVAAHLLTRRFKSLKRELRQANLRKRLVKSDGLYKDDEGWNDWIDNFDGSIEDAIGAEIANLFGVEFEFFESRGKTEFEFDWKKVINNYQVRNNRTIKNVGQDTLEDVQQIVNDWFQTEAGLKDLIDLLEPLFGSARAELIAITEMNYAASEVFDETCKNYGITTWLWDAGADACDDCLEKAAAGPYKIGDEMPPLHPHCYCSEVYADDEGEMI